MSVNVLTETVIHAPVEQVAAFASDPTNAPQWYVNIHTVEWQTEPAVEVGRSAAFLAQFMGRRMAYTYEIKAYEPGKRLVMAADDGPFPMQTEYTWEATADGATRMTLRNSGGPKGLMRLFAPMMASQMRKANEKDLAALKALMESQST